MQNFTKKKFFIEKLLFGERRGNFVFGFFFIKLIRIMSQRWIGPFVIGFECEESTNRHETQGCRSDRRSLEVRDARPTFTWH